MINYIHLVLIIVAASVAYVWIFRIDNIIKEFKQFGLSNLTRTFVGAIKIALATLLIVGIWHPLFITIPAILMGLLMIAAQYFHFKIKNPFIKHLPSFVLLILCFFLTLASLNII
ncbi:MAG: DoxX family protein [Flavobacterium sp.]|nr:DoxX family protein [Pedobacter sp.]